MNGPDDRGIRAAASEKRREDARSFGVARLRPVSPGVSRPIIKQRPDGPLAHYHIHEHGKCIRSDTPHFSSPLPTRFFPALMRIVLANACGGVHRRASNILWVATRLSRWPSFSPPLPSPMHPRAVVVAEKSSDHSRSPDRRNSSIRLAFIAKEARVCPPSRDVLEIPVHFFERSWRTKGEKRDV